MKSAVLSKGYFSFNFFHSGAAFLHNAVEIEKPFEVFCKRKLEIVLIKPFFLLILIEDTFEPLESEDKMKTAK